MLISIYIFEPRHVKTNVLVSDLVRHKPGYAVTEDGSASLFSHMQNVGFS